jgi:predicted transcriptional regulator
MQTDEIQKLIEKAASAVDELTTNGVSMDQIIEVLELIDRGIYQPYEPELLAKLKPSQINNNSAV